MRGYFYCKCRNVIYGMYGGVRFIMKDVGKCMQGGYSAHVGYFLIGLRGSGRHCAGV